MFYALSWACGHQSEPESRVYVRTGSCIVSAWVSCAVNVVTQATKVPVMGLAVSRAYGCSEVYRTCGKVIRQHLPLRIGDEAMCCVVVDR